jgi:Ni,Fe-hydrogenase I small subunit
MYEGIILPVKAIRMLSAEHHNRIINDPSVKATFGKTEGDVDVSALLDEPENYVLMAHGDVVAIFEWSAPDIWQAHYAALPTARGRDAVAGLCAMAADMFASGTRSIWGQIPVGNKAARAMARMIGAVPKGFVDRESEGVCELFMLEAR